jgi:hypothetical protein
VNEVMTSAPIVCVITPTPRVPEGTGRNVALDFTKGFLVLLMVVYHWFNYFVGQSEIYKYIRFLTPSFIFITGFIVSNIYFTKYDVHNPRLPAGLAIRALKIIAVFVALNVVVSAAVPGYGTIHPTIIRLFVNHFLGVVTPGVKDAAFTVLMPIGQLLLLSAVLIFVYRLSRYVVHVFCALAFAIVIFLRMSGTSNPNAELIAIGSLGMVLGMVPLARLIRIVNRPLLLAVAYVLFDLAVSRWGEAYILQVLGVCLSISVIYVIGASRWAATWLGKVVVLLGKYSLFGYISQIAILQVLHRVLTTNSLGASRFATSFLLAFVLTTCSVMLLSAARQRSGAIDRSYKFIFA